MARARAISEQFAIARRETIEATRQAVIRTAHTEHARVMGTDPEPDGFRVFVDGRRDAAEETVTPFGVILYEYQRLDIVAQFVLETLIARSPVGPPEAGHYREGHTIYLNETAVTSVADYQPGDRILISNPFRYSRKIELGTMTMQVPGTDHVYAQAEQAARRQYSAIAQIDFTYWDFGGERQPAITIRERR